MNVTQLAWIVGGYAAGLAVLSSINALFRRHLRERVPSKQVKRVQTVSSLLHAVAQTTLLVTVLVWILRSVGMDPSPVLASAGILGLAVGFGAQALVRDFLSGMFIILENQYGVGDTVRINGQEGVVQALSIRLTRLLDQDGNSIMIPNGTVSIVVNLRVAPPPLL